MKNISEFKKKLLRITRITGDMKIINDKECHYSINDGAIVPQSKHIAQLTFIHIIYKP